MMREGGLAGHRLGIEPIHAGREWRGHGCRKRGLAVVAVSMFSIPAAQARRRQSDFDSAGEQLMAEHADRRWPSSNPS